MYQFRNGCEQLRCVRERVQHRGQLYRGFVRSADANRHPGTHRDTNRYSDAPGDANQHTIFVHRCGVSGVPDLRSDSRRLCGSSAE